MLKKLNNAMIGFIITSISFIWWKSLPSFSLIGLLLFLTLVLGCLSNKPNFVFGCLFACIICTVQAKYVTHNALDDKYFNTPVLISGKVSSIQLVRDPKGNVSQTFDIIVERIARLNLLIPIKIRLSWLGGDTVVKQGQKLRLLVQLKRGIRRLNPNRFNFQKWLISSKYIATGYVKRSHSNKYLDNNIGFRQRLAERIHALQHKHSSLILALSLGEKSAVEQDIMERIQKSGTAHLFAISGLHLSSILLIGLTLVKTFTRALFLHSKNKKQRNTYKLTFVLTLPILTYYAYLAGLNLPVVRAIITFILYVLLVSISVHWKPAPFLLVLLSVFCFLMPLSTLSSSFWFSFTAVLCICYYSWMSKTVRLKKHWLVEPVFLQVYLCIMMFPIVTYFFGYLSLSSVFSNIIAVPIVSLVIVPLSLLGTLAISFELEFSKHIFDLVDTLLSFVLFICEVFSSESWIINFGIRPDPIFIFVICFSLLLSFLPYWPYKRFILFVSFISSLLMLSARQMEKNYLYLLDVGHGLSSVLVSDNHVLMYDTGGRYPSGFSMSEAVVLPFLRDKAIDSIDHLFISHDDIDHSGGINDIVSSIRVKTTISPNEHCFFANPDDQNLQTTEYMVDIYWPLRSIKRANNNDSCVIKVTMLKSGIRILFTGDIEQQTEHKLLNMHETKEIDLGSDILIVPHHGSKTSSSLAFLMAVNPKLALISAGHSTRLNQPSKNTLKRLSYLGIEVRSTSEEGQIKVKLDNTLKITSTRNDLAPFWYNNISKL